MNSAWAFGSEQKRTNWRATSAFGPPLGRPQPSIEYRPWFQTILAGVPPSIAASKQYRCVDNSLAFVDVYSDGTSASVRTTADGPATRIEAPAPGEAMVGGGYSLKGARTDVNITFASPAKPKGQRCHV